ncbi:MAG: hypothetical protein MZU95_00140 [Desulfomicrobium escambiense]|nr:hypothetical protein [Desulfomicrobium escambiense]
MCPGDWYVPLLMSTRKSSRVSRLPDRDSLVDGRSKRDKLKLVFEPFKVVSVDELGSVDVLLYLALHLVKGCLVYQLYPHHRSNSPCEACGDQKSYDEAAL